MWWGVSGVADWWWEGGREGFFGLVWGGWGGGGFVGRTDADSFVRALNYTGLGGTAVGQIRGKPWETRARSPSYRPYVYALRPPSS